MVKFNFIEFTIHTSTQVYQRPHKRKKWTKRMTGKVEIRVQIQGIKQAMVMSPSRDPGILRVAFRWVVRRNLSLGIWGKGQEVYAPHSGRSWVLLMGIRTSNWTMPALNGEEEVGRGMEDAGRWRDTYLKWDVRRTMNRRKGRVHDADPHQPV